MPSLRDWVSDQLHSLLGYSEGYLADYVTSIASTEVSAASLLAKLHAADIPTTPAARKFAEELFGRAPRQQQPGSSSRAKEAAEQKEQVALLKKNESYAMVDDEDDEAAETEAAVQRALQERERERLRTQRKRARGGPGEGGESGAGGSDSAAAGGAGGADAGADAEGDAAAEAERSRDLAERDEFAERLRQRDLAKTRKLGDDALAVVGRREEEQKLLKANDDERGALLDELRKVSRQVYLEKREKQKLEEARDDVRDEEYLFGDVQLTDREKRERELKKRLYDLAQQRVNLSDKVERYQMPTAYDDMESGPKQDERFGGMMARYQEEEGEEMNEFQVWIKVLCSGPKMEHGQTSLEHAVRAVS
jgi:pre-mRNA-splicing factor ATP-dependent RNA helicase DHX16